MTIVPIHPKATPASTVPPDQRVLASLAAAIARIDGRVKSLEATRTQIGANAITSSEVGPNQINGTHIAPNSISTGQITAGSIDASIINAASIGAAVGQFVSINASQIVAGDITATAMQTNVLSAVQASISSLSAISANMGSITAGTISGGTFKTPDSRLIFDSLGIRGYKTDGVTKVFEMNTGTGIVTVTGIVYADASSVIPGSTIPSGTLPGDSIFPASITTLQMAAGSITANNIVAGAIQAQHISFAFGGNNRLTNPGFENNTTALETETTQPGWATTSALAMRTTLQIQQGSSGLRLRATNTNTMVLTSVNVPALASQNYVASIYTMSGFGSRGLTLALKFYDTNGILLQTTTATLTPTTTWLRCQVTAIAPANTSFGVMTATFAAGGAGDTVYVDSAQFEAGSVASPWGPNPNEILPGSVGNTQIGPDAITTDKILAGTITAGDMTVSTLSAISANMGTITAGTITGATVQTAASGARALMDSSGFRYFDATGTTIFSAIGGVVTVRGQITATSLALANVTNTFGGGGNTLSWYSDNLVTRVAYLSTGWSGSNSVTEQYNVSSGAAGIAEWRSVVASGTEGTKTVLDHQSVAGGVDSLRYSWVNATGTSFLKFGVDENGVTTITGDIYTHPGTAGAQRWWWTGNAFLDIFEYWGFRISGGNYTYNTYGGGGMAHVVLGGSGDTTQGTTYTLGNSYALVHSNYSDAKLKHSIRDIDHTAALSRVRALRPRQWAFKGGSGTSHQERGLIAQEVGEIIPDAVERLISEDGEVTLSYKPDAVIAQLIAAVQELSEAVNILRGEAPDARLARDNVKPIVMK